MGNSESTNVRQCICNTSSASDEWILCDGCLNWFHRNCVCLTNEEFEVILHKNEKWFCNNQDCQLKKNEILHPKKPLEDNLVCPDCDFIPKNRHGLNIHMRKHKKIHDLISLTDQDIPKQQNVDKNNSNTTIFECKPCKRQFDTFKGLQIHRSHHNKISTKIILKKSERNCTLSQQESHLLQQSQSQSQSQDVNESNNIQTNTLKDSEFENDQIDLNEFLKLVEESNKDQNESSHHESHQCDENSKKCIHCPPNLTHKTYRGVRGLKIHHFKMHKDIEFSFFDTDQNQNNVSIDSIETRLGNLNKNIKIIKRIPKGARFAAANELSKVTNTCVQKNDLNSWQNLLFFAYSAFQVPKRKSKSQSLTRIVKHNIKNLNSQPLNKKIEVKVQRQLPLNKRVEAKISDGDIRGATKLLMSSDTLANQDNETFNLLKEKHPEPSRTLNLPDPPDNSIKYLVASEEDVKKSIFSFYNGSAAGIDGISPQHLKDMLSITNGEAGVKLLKSTTSLTNLMLSGKVLQSICKITYGARLCALKKKDGGIRPIAIGSTFRRISAKVACGSVREELGSYLRPKQVGFSTKGGCEAAIHACRSYLKNNKKLRKMILKIDFKNAFNCVERDVLLQTIKEKAPSIYAFMWQCYSSTSSLFFGYEQISSEVGAQQGDPCGPMAFSLSIHPIIEMLSSELNIWYLDDGTLGGDPETVFEDFKLLIQECKKIGLEINPAKCEIYFCGEEDLSIIDKFNVVSPGIKIISNDDLELLGAPITEAAEERVFTRLHNKLKVMFERIGQLNFHMAYHLLKHCFSIPKVTYLLRTTAYFKHERLLNKLDEDIKNTLETICNSEFNNQQWSLISLPIRCGGLGIRKASEICLPAFLSSVNSVFNLVTLMYPQLSDETMVTDYDCAMEKWSSFFTSIPDDKSRQQSWDNLIISEKIENLSFHSIKDKARYLASTVHESNGWLSVLPSKTIGTLLDNNTFRISIALRFGINICSRHKCVCGEWVEKDGTHGLSCLYSAGRFPRHAEFNNTIHRGIQSGNIPSLREPPGMFSDDGKRVDGTTLVPWSRGQHLVWDATCSDTLAPSHLHLSSIKAGAVAKKAANIKLNKYKQLAEQNYIILPFAIETLGPWCDEAIKFVDILGKLVQERTNEPKSTIYLKQRISITLQRSNAASVMGTFGEDFEKLDEIFYIL